MELTHLNKETTDGTVRNLDALYQLFPSCFTEAKDAVTGKMRRVVDWGKLRELLGEYVETDEPEKYDFTWVGKRAAQREAAAPCRKTLRPCPEESADWDTTQNLYIEGDNLEVLKLLQNSYMGKVKMIYIDPPYNTGNDFVYHDDFAQSADEYDEHNLDDEGNRFRKNTDRPSRWDLVAGPSRWDRYLGMTAPMTQVPVPTATVDAENRAYCLLPYRNMDDIYQVNANKRYLFFSQEEAPAEEQPLVDEYALTCERQMEYNYIYVIFSRNQFTKANDAASNKQIDGYAGAPRELSYEDFQKWLGKCMKHDAEMNMKKIPITIKK